MDQSPKKLLNKEGESEETAEPLELSIATRQSEMPEKTSLSVPAADDKDWTGTSMAIKVIVGIMVILLIGLAVREKKKR